MPSLWLTQKKPVQDGYDRVSMATELTVDVLKNDFGVRRGHAGAFVNAAKAVQVTLGYMTGDQADSTLTPIKPNPSPSHSARSPYRTLYLAGLSIDSSA